MNICSLSRATKSKSDSSMIAMELRGVHIYDGVCLFICGVCSATQGLHAVLLRVGIM